MTAAHAALRCVSACATHFPAFVAPFAKQIVEVTEPFRDPGRLHPRRGAAGKVVHANKSTVRQEPERCDNRVRSADRIFQGLVAVQPIDIFYALVSSVGV